MGIISGSVDPCFLLLMWYWRVKSDTQKLLGPQREAHVAPHSTCASRCSLGKVNSTFGLTLGTTLGSFYLQLYRTRASGAATGSACPPAFNMCFQLQFPKHCPMNIDTVEGVSVPDATTVIPRHHPEFN